MFNQNNKQMNKKQKISKECYNTLKGELFVITSNSLAEESVLTLPIGYFRDYVIVGVIKGERFGPEVFTGKGAVIKVSLRNYPKGLMRIPIGVVPAIVPRMYTIYCDNCTYSKDCPIYNLVWQLR